MLEHDNGLQNDDDNIVRYSQWHNKWIWRIT